MTHVQIYHNPHCSKSRATLELLRARGISPEIIEYLNNPPGKETLHTLLKKLDVDSKDLVRVSEPEFKQTGFDSKSLTEIQVIESILQFPKLMQRPVVVNGDAARIGRPPKNVLEIL